MREKSFDSMNVVPFIDVMLVLLTIVLATATFMKTGVIPVQLPVVEHSEVEASLESMVLDISADGFIYLGDTRLTVEELGLKLGTIQKTSTIIIRADKDSNIQPFAHLMSVLRERGFEKVNLQTEVQN